MRMNETFAAPGDDFPGATDRISQRLEHRDRDVATGGRIRSLEAVVEEAIAAMDRATRHAVFELAGWDDTKPPGRSTS